MGKSFEVRLRASDQALKELKNDLLKVILLPLLRDLASLLAVAYFHEMHGYICALVAS